MGTTAKQLERIQSVVDTFTPETIERVLSATLRVEAQGISRRAGLSGHHYDIVKAVENKTGRTAAIWSASK